MEGQTNTQGAVSAAMAKAAREGQRVGAYAPASASAPRDGRLRRMLKLRTAPASRARPQSFSISKMLSGLIQGLVFLPLLVVVRNMAVGAPVAESILWAILALLVQTMALTFFIMRKSP